MYKNFTEILIASTQLPAAIEGALPAGAPKFSEMLVDAFGRLPKVPDLPIEVPDLPSIPALPAAPELPGAGLRRRFVTGVEVTPVGALAPNKAVPVSPEREKVPLVFE